MIPAPSFKIGIVIGTFSAVPYVHLHLEAARRMYYDVPILIHDDASEQGPLLEKLAKSYGAEFTTHPLRHSHSLGDLSAYTAGLEWANRRGLDILVKLSRRWIWLTDWRRDLLRLNDQTASPTFSYHSTSYNLGFRTECLALRVRNWWCKSFLVDAQTKIRAGESLFIESFMHKWAIILSDQCLTPKWMSWQTQNTVHLGRRGYAPWSIMGECRNAKHPTRLWHNSNPPRDYAVLSKKWGLPYAECDFINPDNYLSI